MILSLLAIIACVSVGGCIASFLGGLLGNRRESDSVEWCDAETETRTSYRILQERAK